MNNGSILYLYKQAHECNHRLRTALVFFHLQNLSSGSSGSILACGVMGIPALLPLTSKWSRMSSPTIPGHKHRCVPTVQGFLGLCLMSCVGCVVVADIHLSALWLLQIGLAGNPGRPGYPNRMSIGTRSLYAGAPALQPPYRKRYAPMPIVVFGAEAPCHASASAPWPT